MAYKKVKEENGEYALVIDGWQNGTAPDPYSGINRMYTVNLTVDGEVSVGYPITTSVTSGGTLGKPIARSTRFFNTYGSPNTPADSPKSFSILDILGQVWESTSITGTWNFLSSNSMTTSASGNDGVIDWLGFKFKTRGVNIDYWNGATWSNGWYGGLQVSKHFMYVASDNVLYITNGNMLASITLADPSSPATFDPTNPTTYVITPNKLQLGVTDLSFSLAEVGGGNTPNSTLLIGTVGNVIYPWDKTSPNFSLPIYVADAYIKNLISVNQNVFIFTGNLQGRGRIYITNGSQADEWFKMPDYLFGIQDPYYEFGDAVFNRNQIIFGTFVDSNAGSTQLISEIWAIDLKTKVFRSVSELSTGSGKANATALLSTGNLSTPGLGFIVGWDDNAGAPGIGYSGTTAGIGTASIITDLIPVGTLYQKNTLHQIEFKLRSPLQSGESISITPVVDAVTGSALVFNPTVTTGSISGVAPVNFQGAQWLQFQIALTGNSATSGVRLKELRIR